MSRPENPDNKTTMRHKAVRLWVSLWGKTQSSIVALVVGVIIFLAVVVMLLYVAENIMNAPTSQPLNPNLPVQLAVLQGQVDAFSATASRDKATLQAQFEAVSTQAVAGAAETIDAINIQLTAIAQESNDQLTEVANIAITLGASDQAVSTALSQLESEISQVGTEVSSANIPLQKTVSALVEDQATLEAAVCIVTPTASSITVRKAPRIESDPSRVLGYLFANQEVEATYHNGVAIAQGRWWLVKFITSENLVVDGWVLETTVMQINTPENFQACARIKRAPGSY